MISCLISFLIAALIMMLVFWVVRLVAAAFGVGIPTPVMQIIGIILFLILLLSYLPCLSGGYAGGLYVPWNQRLR